ncbi:AhpC/TSA antioxidant enzyme-domain-containing protein [Fomitopsis serialis]|uniref:AhpC/TSA antioxidant enzyme-domain-containing protein n=1 Tax=Fomitopsis serialis TaxID=139415 RepID=UPI002008AD7C|nr:AhpC/TSA antioxidant enzyme-domain-containing protein [Neoantrodia serialis]KAH9926481.1 AhpC/TSA antioxidant enzyme-domain-containing protein [Neoantrodia serialis]
MADHAPQSSTHTLIPSTEAITSTAKLPVFDSQGNSTDFGSLFRDQKTIVVFIRHFFCGSCQQYVMQLAEVPQESLQQAGVRLVVIGCGDWQPIQNYCDTTGFKGEMYADPSRALYTALGLVESLDVTPSGQEKRSYITRSLLRNALRSILQGPLKTPQHIGKQGKISQLGGDFVFGPGETCSFASRMRHTEDHIEVADLMRTAGVAES